MRVTCSQLNFLILKELFPGIELTMKLMRKSHITVIYTAWVVLYHDCVRGISAIHRCIAPVPFVLLGPNSLRLNSIIWILVASLTFDKRYCNV